MKRKVLIKKLNSSNRTKYYQSGDIGYLEEYATHEGILYGVILIGNSVHLVNADEFDFLDKDCSFLEKMIELASKKMELLKFVFEMEKRGKTPKEILDFYEPYLNFIQLYEKEISKKIE